MKIKVNINSDGDYAIIYDGSSGIMVGGIEQTGDDEFTVKMKIHGDVSIPALDGLTGATVLGASEAIMARLEQGDVNVTLDNRRAVTQAENDCFWFSECRDLNCLAWPRVRRVPRQRKFAGSAVRNL